MSSDAFFFFDLLFSYKSSPSPLQQQLQQQCDQINKCRIDMSVFMIARGCVARIGQRSFGGGGPRQVRQHLGVLLANLISLGDEKEMSCLDKTNDDVL